MRLYIYPKVNVFLTIRNKIGARHNLTSRFALAYGALHDVMEVSQSEGFMLVGEFDCALEDNLIYKALLGLKEYLRQRGAPTLLQECVMDVRVLVDKGIGAGAGLGGGSANAAAILFAIDSLYSLRLGLDAKLEIGKKLGADVCYFITAMHTEPDLFTQPFSKERQSELASSKGANEAANERASKANSATLASLGIDERLAGRLNLACHSALLLCSMSASLDGSLLEPFSDAPTYITLLTSDIACNTGAVYARFDEMMLEGIAPPSFSPKEAIKEYASINRQVLNNLLAPALSLYTSLEELDSALSPSFKLSGSGSAYFSIVS